MRSKDFPPIGQADHMQLQNEGGENALIVYYLTMSRILYGWYIIDFDSTSQYCTRSNFDIAVPRRTNKKVPYRRTNKRKSAVHCNYEFQDINL